MSVRRAESNRTNAAKSSGPRTAAGKRVSSRTAVSHGLNVPLAHNAPELQPLADALAGLGRGDPGVDEASRQAARALVNYRRVQSHYRALYQQHDRSVQSEQATSVVNDSHSPLEIAVRQLLEQIAPPSIRSAQKTTLVHLVSDLDKLARYERRSWSARNTALARLDTALRDFDDQRDRS